MIRNLGRQKEEGNEEERKGVRSREEGRGNKSFVR